MFERNASILHLWNTYIKSEQITGGYPEFDAPIERQSNLTEI